MVRLIPVDVRGKIEWGPDAPDTCPCGYEGVLPPTWGGCPVCHVPVMRWRCPDCRELQVDDEHVHRAGPLPASARRGA